MCFRALASDLILEPLLRKVRRTVGFFIRRGQLFPVLDLCCGTGAQAGLLSSHGKVVGIDLDLEVLSHASSRRKRPSFVCADASRLPFRNSSFRGIVVSFALHDKGSNLRRSLMQEAMRLLAPGGRIVFVDFEPAWNVRSRWGGLLVFFIELFAGREHFKNGRSFVRRGGLGGSLRNTGLVIEERRDFEAGSSIMTVSSRSNEPHGGTP